MPLRESKVAEIFFRGLLCFLGILGNLSLLLCSLPSKHSRIETYKVLFINLALSNLLTNCMVDIPSILAEVYETWFLGNIYCKIYMFTASLTITDSILTTLTISIFWFHKLVVSRPANCKMLQKSELRLLGISLTVGWIVAIIFSTPLFSYCSVYVMKNGNEESQKESVERIFACGDGFPTGFQKSTYEFMYLLLANALPIISMLVINIRIITVLTRNRRRITALKLPKKERCQATNSKLIISPRLNMGTENCKAIGSTDPKSEGQKNCVGNIVFKQSMSCVSTTTKGLIAIENSSPNVDSKVKVIISNVERRVLFQRLSPNEKETLNNEKEELQPVSIIYDPCMLSYNKVAQEAFICNVESNGLVPESNTMHLHEEFDQPATCNSEMVYAVPACPQESCLLEDTKAQFTNKQCPAKTPSRHLSAETQIRATISITAVVGIFFAFWLVHLVLRIQVSTGGSKELANIASVIAASYTTVIPYIFIYGLGKCPCR
ncbi:rhodopsin-like [Pelobates cultripes]|uniref:Rhodopsin-like n=1 Tax=Pelobates cultripes TaxID=61616 RepID=A0AAD1SB04_PELCU|nr:rhodopsin-like [Pelobates cultripes]